MRRWGDTEIIQDHASSWNESKLTIYVFSLEAIRSCANFPHYSGLFQSIYLFANIMFCNVHLN